MKSEAVKKLALSFGIGIGGGVALGLVDVPGVLELDAGAAIVAGLLLTVVTELALIILAQDRADRERRDLLSRAELIPRLREAQRRSERATLGIASAARELSPGGGRFARFMAQNLIESLHKESRRVLEDGLEIEASEVPLFWTTCLLNADSTVKVASFIDPAAWWEKPYGRANVAVQKDKVRDDGLQITRIFIVDGDPEVERIRDTAEDQYRAGLTVRYIRRTEIDDDPLLAGHRDKAGSYDVALIGPGWTVVHYLDLEPGAEHRHTRKLLMTKNPERREAVRSYLSLLEESAHRFDFETEESRAPAEA